MARSPDTVTTDDEANAALAAAGYTGATLTHHGHVWVGTATDSAGMAGHVVVHGKDGRISFDAADVEEPEAEGA